MVSWGPSLNGPGFSFIQRVLGLWSSDPMDCSPPGSPVPGILQARTLGWVDISFSNAWKWKVKVKSLSCVWLLATPWTAAHQAPPIYGIFQARVLEWGAIALEHLFQQTTKFWCRFRTGGASGKQPCCQCRRHKRHELHLWVGKIPWGRPWQPAPVFLPGGSHGQSSLSGYSPCGPKESDNWSNLACTI